MQFGSIVAAAMTGEESRNTKEERERYQELLGELRTIIPGAQVLFAFLLTAPFAGRFSQVDYLGKIIFSISLGSIAAATILFLAPAAYHRLADHRDRRGRLRFGVKTTLTGLFLLGVSITCVIFVVIRFIFDSSIAGAVLAAFAALLQVIMWYILPMRGR